MNDSFTERRMRLARKAKKSDPNFLHAQLVLAGRRVTRDMIVDGSHVYYFDCGCVRAYHLSTELTAKETLEPCLEHTGLLRLVEPRRPPR